MIRGFVITQAGEALLARAAAGEILEITGAWVGSGTAAGPDAARLLAGLVEPVAEAAVSRPIAEENSWHFVVEYRNDVDGGPEAGFTLREFGVFGRVGEDAALLYYGALGDGAQQIHPLSQGLEVRQYPVALALTAEAEVALTYPPGVFVTQAELEQLGLLRPFGPVAVTIPLSWAGSGPWTQEVAVEGVTADMELLHLSLAKTTDSAAGRAQEQGIVCVTYCETVDGGLLLTCRDKKPTVALSCILKGVE